jgi:2',3'-cyclic-nucleotide 2'-phosphodiesterase (5'-nucleotidase family)
MKHFIPLILLFVLGSCQVKHLIDANGQERVELVQNDDKDSSLIHVILPYQKEMKLKMDSIIGQADHKFERARPESDLGNFVTDLTFKYGVNELNREGLIKDQTEVVAILNTGGLRSIISKGPITIGDCFTLMPFNNEIVILKLSGEKIEEMLYYLEEKGGEPVSNIKLRFTKYSNKELSYTCSIGGKTFDKSKDYYVVTSDYLAKGGDKMNFLLEPKEFIQTGKLLRDAIIDEVKTTQGSIEGEVDGRIKFIKDE